MIVADTRSWKSSHRRDFGDFRVARIVVLVCGSFRLEGGDWGRGVVFEFEYFFKVKRKERGQYCVCAVGRVE